jgi:hypothetical protein
MIRAVLASLLGLLLLTTQAHAQEWRSTRLGAFDWVCEQTNGTLVSGHQRFDLAAQRCAAESAAHPANKYQVRGAAYTINVMSSPPPAATLALDPTCNAFAVALDVKIGTPFTGPTLAPCFTGTEALTASYALVSHDTSPAPASVHFSVTPAGVISNDGAVGLTAQIGNLWVRRVTSDGVAVEVSLPWRLK